MELCLGPILLVTSKIEEVSKTQVLSVRGRIEFVCTEVSLGSMFFWSLCNG